MFRQFINGGDVFSPLFLQSCRMITGESSKYQTIRRAIRHHPATAFWVCRNADGRLRCRRRGISRHLSSTLAESRDVRPPTRFPRLGLRFCPEHTREWRHKHSSRQSLLSECALEEIAETRFRLSAALEAWHSVLSECLQKLSPEHNELVRRCYIGKEPIHVVAANMNVSPGSLYTRLSRIRRKLFECLDKAFKEE